MICLNNLRVLGNNLTAQIRLQLIYELFVLVLNVVNLATFRFEYLLQKFLAVHLTNLA